MLHPPDIEPTVSGSATRSYVPGDLDHVADLYRRVGTPNPDRRLQAFRWITEANPWVDGETSYLLFVDDGLVAGYLGRMPARLFVGGEAVPCVYSQEALVDPNLRGRGVATTLFQVANLTPRPMLSLWHNERIVSLLSKTGWTNTGRLPSFRKLYRIDRLLAERYRTAAARWFGAAVAPVHRALSSAPYGPREGPMPESVTTFGGEFDALFERAVVQHGVIADRSAAVLQWKYAAIPHQRYRIMVVRRRGALAAYAVVRVQDNDAGIRKGMVIDVLGDLSDIRAMDQLAGAIDRYFQAQDVDLAACIIAPRPFQEAFRRVGFRQARPTAVSTLWVRNQELASAEQANRLTRIDQWYVTLGDSDSDMW